MYREVCLISMLFILKLISNTDQYRSVHQLRNTIKEVQMKTYIMQKEGQLFMIKSLQWSKRTVNGGSQVALEEWEDYQ
jgi:hypothetical protein